MQKKVVYGPPGTGKTTFLLKLIEKELETSDPNDIAFVSFTNQGVNEGTNRACKKFGFKKKDLNYFRTLHSLCFRAMNANREEMISKKDYRLFSDATGISFCGYYTEDMRSENDSYLHCVSLEKHHPKAAERMKKRLVNDRYIYIRFQYSELKKQLGIKDYDDLLIDYLNHGKPLKIKTAFIDEAQDLTQLQWKVAEKMFSNAETVYVAGDDDQAVYEWAGADVKKFMGYSSDELVLNKSYRLPESVLQIAKRVTEDVRIRKDKQFVSNGEEGEVVMTTSPHYAKLKGGELVLARTNAEAKRLSAIAAEKGLPFSIKGKLSLDKKIVKAISLYDSYSQHGAMTEELHNNRHMFKNLDRGLPWQVELDIDRDHLDYYERVYAKGTQDVEPVMFNTFHGSKGSENKHVILSTGLSTKVAKNFVDERDAELRCLYVGLTRTKNKLTIISEMGTNSYPHKYFT